MRKNNQRKRLGCLLILMGLLLLAAALFLVLMNLSEEEEAGDAASAVLARLEQEIPEEGRADRLILTDPSGEEIDWPKTDGGEPMPWPADEAGKPAALVTDGEGTVFLWEGDRPAILATAAPAKNPTAVPATAVPATAAPAKNPTAEPVTAAPAKIPTAVPATAALAKNPTAEPVTAAPVQDPTAVPATAAPAKIPTAMPVTAVPAQIPTAAPQDDAETLDQEMIDAIAQSDRELTEEETEAIHSLTQTLKQAIAGRSQDAEDGEQTWPVDKNGDILPYIADGDGQAVAWPTAPDGEALEWAKIQGEWQSVLAQMLPYLLYTAPQPPFVTYPDMAMPTEEIDGHGYIGMLEIPVLELQLPIMSDWSYPKLKIAPCRYVGSAYSGDMIIAGHNYKRHFGRLKELEEGDEVRFTDAEGNVFLYSVCGKETLKKRQGEELREGEWDMTLFTCTKGGATRVTVRCLLESYVWKDAPVGEYETWTQETEE